MFVPPVLREWVADNELAHLAFKAVEFSESARLNARASGSEQYPPTMMLALVIYSYATDLISSRRIERATYDNVTVRYLCANHPPIIAKFGRENEALFRRIRTTITLSKSAAQCEHVLLVLCPPQRRHNAREHKPRRKGHLARQRTRAQAGPLRSVSLGFSFERSPEPLAVSFFLSSALG